MPLSVGTDTYATVEQADAYCAARPELAAWLALGEARKELNLTDAADYLDTSYVWKGRIAALSQLMAFPRVDLKDREGRTITGIPGQVITAQIELAVMRINGPLVAGSADPDVESIRAGEVSIKFVNGTRLNEAALFKNIDRILTGLYVSRSGAKVMNVPLARS